VIPIITGTAHVTGENLLRLDPEDPFCGEFAHDRTAGFNR